MHYRIERFESRRLFSEALWIQTYKLMFDAAAGDSFGESVALSGDIAIVGNETDDDNGVNSGSAYLFNPASGNRIAKLKPDDGAAFDFFGCSVALSGNTALVGSYLDSDNGTYSGSAYLFDATTGEQIAKLTPDDAAAYDYFGQSVAISGNIALVGKYTDKDNGEASGSAYLFNASTGHQIAKLKPDDGAADDFFGSRVAISGNTVLVSSFRDDDNGQNSGSAYLFDATTGDQIAKLKPTDGAASDGFGSSLAISGDTALVGSPGDDDNGTSSGSIYLFNSTTGVQLAKVKPGDGGEGDSFGSSVALSGSTALVGSPGDDDNGSRSGSAYLFNATTGDQIAKLKPADGAASDRFGSSLAIRGDAALVGSPYDYYDNAATCGSAYLFQDVSIRPPDMLIDPFASGVSPIPSGGSLPLSFRIRNTGGPAPASKARLRLSLDDNLTRYDLPLSPLDVSIPPIAAGGYYDYTGTVTVPAGTPAGSYYVGVFADALNSAGQSDITNDAGLSATKVTITPTGLTPIIIKAPDPLTLVAGGAGEFVVSATLPGSASGDWNQTAPPALWYEWFHDGRPTGAQGYGLDKLRISNASELQAGDYSVRVTAQGGFSAQSTPKKLIVQATDSDGRHPENGRLISFTGDFIHERPTVILTHGWQKKHEFPWFDSSGNLRADPYKHALDQGEEWVSDFKTFAEDVSHRTGYNANVYVYVWSGAFTGGGAPGINADFAATEGVKIGRRLATDFIALAAGSPYTQAIHFIAHSAGTLVNANAVDELKEQGWSNGAAPMQFTMLDPPLVWRKRGIEIYEFSQYDKDVYFQNLLPDAGTTYGVDWVDNYWGDTGNAIGLPVTGASGGFPTGVVDGGYHVKGQDHSGVRVWYVHTVQVSTTETSGFDYSVVLNDQWNNRRLPTWPVPRPTLPPPIYQTTPMFLGSATSPGWRVQFGTATAGAENVHEQTTLTFSAAPTAAPRLRATSDSDDDQPNALISLDMFLEDGTSTLEFDYRLTSATPGVTLAVMFNSTTLYEFDAAVAASGGFRHVSVPVSMHAGEAGVLAVALYGTTDPNTVLTLANVRTADLIAPGASVAFEFETAQQIRLTFDESVGTTLSLADLVVVNAKTNVAVPASELNLTVAPDARSAILARVSGLFADGEYTVRLAAGTVEDAAGNRLPIDIEYNFHVLAGDANRDRTVNFDDLLVLAQNYGQSGRTFSQGNFNYSPDGKVDFDDLLILAQRYGTSLLTAAPIAGTPVANRTRRTAAVADVLQ